MVYYDENTEKIFKHLTQSPGNIPLSRVQNYAVGHLYEVDIYKLNEHLSVLSNLNLIGFDNNHITKTSEFSEAVSLGGIGEYIKHRKQKEQEAKELVVSTLDTNKSIIETNESIRETNESVKITNSSVQITNESVRTTNETAIKTNQSIQILNDKMIEMARFQKWTTGLTLFIAILALIINVQQCTDNRDQSKLKDSIKQLEQKPDSTKTN